MSTVKIGWAKREISTDWRVLIPGQMHQRISKGIHDPLLVNVLCVDGGEGQDAVFFCTCDVTVLRGGVLQQTLDKVAALRPELPVANIIMGATHTHTSCHLTQKKEVAEDGSPIVNSEKYNDFFTDMCAEAICEAWDTRSEGGISYGYGYAVVAHSRRTIYLEDLSAGDPLAVAPNGFGSMYGDTKKDIFSHYEAGADHFLNAMFTFDKNQKLTGMVINVPCPSQISEMMEKLSADFWNEVRELVKKEFGPDVFVLPQCAAAGDLSPRVLHYKEAQARRMKLKYGLEYDPAGSNHQYNKGMAERYDIAERILESVRDVYGWAKKEVVTELPVRHISRTLPLPKRMITPEERDECVQKLEALESLRPQPEEFATEREYLRKLTRYKSIVSRNEAAIERFQQQAEEPTTDVFVHAVQIGEVAFASNRFELFMDYQHRIQARSPFIQTFIIQLAGEEGGSYLPTKRGIFNKGYSASVYENRIGFEGGQELVEGTLKMLKEMKAQDA